MYTPLLSTFINCEAGVYKGLHYFLIFALKHRLRVLVRTASLIFTSLKKSLHNTWTCLRNVFYIHVAKQKDPDHQPCR